MTLTFPAPTSDWGIVIGFGLFHEESDRKKFRRSRYRRMFARRFAQRHPGKTLQWHTPPLWFDVPRDTPHNQLNT